MGFLFFCLGKILALFFPHILHTLPLKVPTSGVPVVPILTVESTWLYLAMSLCSVRSMIMATMPDRKRTMTSEFIMLWEEHTGAGLRVGDAKPLTTQPENSSGRAKYFHSERQTQKLEQRFSTCGSGLLWQTFISKNIHICVITVAHYKQQQKQFYGGRHHNTRSCVKGTLP